jgi:ribosome-binding protein aMBF1 (putative translation factor)
MAMSGHKSWNEISAKVRADPGRRARIEQREQAIETGLTISQLRETRGTTQESVAQRMNVTQSNVSHFERNPNIFLRSLASYIEALGGRLEIRAVFPDEIVTLAVPGTQRQQPDRPQREQAVGL